MNTSKIFISTLTISYRILVDYKLLEDSTMSWLLFPLLGTESNIYLEFYTYLLNE